MPHVGMTAGIATAISIGVDWDGQGTSAAEACPWQDTQCCELSLQALVLMSLTALGALPGRQPVRVYMDGCFDVMHYGHANALRQARALGDQLVLGLISDDEIRRAKGPPVMNYKERKTLVGANKWVDEVIDGEERERT